MLSNFLMSDFIGFFFHCVKQLSCDTIRLSLKNNVKTNIELIYINTSRIVCSVICNILQKEMLFSLDPVVVCSGVLV